MYSETSQLPHEQIVQRKYDRICKYYNGQMKKYLFGSALRHFVLASNLELQMFFWVYGFWAFLLQASYKCYVGALFLASCQIPPLPGYGFFFGYMNSRWLFWGSIFSSKNERIVFGVFCL